MDGSSRFWRQRAEDVPCRLKNAGNEWDMNSAADECGGGKPPRRAKKLLVEGRLDYSCAQQLATHKAAGMLVLYRVGAPLSTALSRCPVAVAGTRSPTPRGGRLAREVGRRLAEVGYTVVTGLARSIDEEAALSALETGGRVVAVLPYLLEKDGRLNWRAAWLLRVAASHNTLASVVAENPIKDGGYVRTWLATRNRIIARLAAALIVPETRFKPSRWGTRHAVERALAAGRLVAVLEPRAGDGDAAEAFECFRRRGAATAKGVEEVLTIKRLCRLSQPAER